MTQHEIDMRFVANATPDARYSLPDNTSQWQEEFDTVVYDAAGKLTDARMQEACKIFAETGVLQIVNTGLQAGSAADIPADVLDGIGFGEQDQFKWGGLTSGRTNLRYISKAMRETDDYPADKFLLPHNEILYQRFMPERLMFYCNHTPPQGRGGRTFAHCAKQTQTYLENAGTVGRSLLDRMHQYGFTIETGFLDDHHPDKPKNYFRSWQDRFGTTDADEAMATCLASKDQFDDAYWLDEADAGDARTLMTSITIPAFKTDARDGETYMLFPRIALDGPHAHNGHRRFLIGERELTPEETALLLQSFLATRQGRYYNPGDILLVDNIRFGHSRESFSGPRKVYASMAGLFWTDDAKAPPKSAAAG